MISLENFSVNENNVLKIFKELTKVPRPSKKEEKAREFIIEFAKKHNLKYVVDQAGNVIVKSIKDDSKPVILQGHMDMVCEKTKDFEIDFDKDPIPYVEEGDYLISHNTTLGADNGIGVALALAAMVDDDNPANIEALFTVNEESGMTGAFNVDPKNITGTTMINLDSANEGMVFGGCAGSKRVEVKFKKTFQDLNDSYIYYYVIVSGLKGGHSGEDIHLNLGNANLILARTLYKFNEEFDFKLIDIYGGSRTNAIPRHAVAKIAVPEDKRILAQNLIVRLNGDFVKELGISDPDVRVNLENAESSDKALSKDTAQNILDFLNLVPNGVNTLSQMEQALVETSSNLAVIDSTEDEIIIHSSIRSSKMSKLENLAEKIKILAKLTDGIYEEEFGYPAWEFDYHSKMNEVAKDVYKKLYGKELVLTVIHAGLEPAVLNDRLKLENVISMGPDIYHLHTPGEKVSISSTERTYEYLIEILKEYKRRVK